MMLVEVQTRVQKLHSQVLICLASSARHYSLVREVGELHFIFEIKNNALYTWNRKIRKIFFLIAAWSRKNRLRLQLRIRAGAEPEPDAH